MALEMHVAVAILRVPEGLDYTGIIADFNPEEQTYKEKLESSTGCVNRGFVADITSSGIHYEFHAETVS